MTSTDGATWTLETITQTGTTWTGITYANGTYVAVGNSAVMSSTDGSAWTTRSPAANNTLEVRDLWQQQVRGRVGKRHQRQGDDEQRRHHLDGRNTSNANQSWYGVAYGNGVFAAVAQESGSTGTLNRVMTSTTCCSHSPATPSRWCPRRFPPRRVPVQRSTGSSTTPMPGLLPEGTGVSGATTGPALTRLPPLPKRSAARGTHSTSTWRPTRTREAAPQSRRTWAGQPSCRHRLPAGPGRLGHRSVDALQSSGQDRQHLVRDARHDHHAAPAEGRWLERQKALSQPSASRMNRASDNTRFTPLSESEAVAGSGHPRATTRLRAAAPPRLPGRRWRAWRATPQAVQIQPAVLVHPVPHVSAPELPGAPGA